MNFTPGLEQEDSFMIVPNEFVKDHALTQNEIDTLMTPDPQYEQAFLRRGMKHKRSFFKKVINFLVKKDWGEKRIFIKMRMNRLMHHELFSRYSQSHKESFL